MQNDRAFLLLPFLLVSTSGCSSVPTDSANSRESAPVLSGSTSATPVSSGSASSESFSAAVAKLEQKFGGRIGVSALNTANGQRFEHRGDERFPLCSTFKTIAVAAVLKKSLTNRGLMKKQIRYSQKDLEGIGHSPITTKNVAKGMSVQELCAATIQYSDNPAANLLMKEIGGPAGVTAFARSVGDETFRLERWEPQLNSAIPGDLKDTSTPKAVTDLLNKTMLGDALPSAERTLLQDWLKGNTTGDTRIRAGAPKDCVVGDKTGTCSYGTTNDIGILWPSEGSPIVLSVYYTQSDKAASPRNEVIAEVTKLVVESLRQ